MDSGRKSQVTNMEFLVSRKSYSNVTKTLLSGNPAQDSADAIVNGADHGKGYGHNHHDAKGWDHGHHETKGWGHHHHHQPSYGHQKGWGDHGYKEGYTLIYKDHDHGHGHGHGWGEDWGGYGGGVDHLGYLHHSYGHDSYGAGKIDHGWGHEGAGHYKGYYVDDHGGWASNQIFRKAKPDRL